LHGSAYLMAKAASCGKIFKKIS